MKKFIFLLDAIELLGRLMSGKRVQGVLYIEEGTGRLTFKPYYSRGQHAKDRLIRPLEHGWVRESKERFKVFHSVPKELGVARVLNVLEREEREVKNALMDWNLIEFM
jgi:hypothetical protein